MWTEGWRRPGRGIKYSGFGFPFGESTGLKMPLEAALKQAGKAVTPEMVVELNRGLNGIRKPV